MVSCILLAAGESKRFGSPKSLAKINAGTVIEHIQKNLLSTKISEIIVVLGSQAETVAPFILKDSRVKTILNKDYKLGQTSSFKAGLSALSARIQGVMLLPVDAPFVKKQTFNLLIKNFLEKQPLILLPVYAAKSGHPPIFSTKLINEFKKLKNDEPLYTVQHAHIPETLKIPVSDEGIIQSFNTPEELNKLTIKKTAKHPPFLAAPSKPSQA